MPLVALAATCLALPACDRERVVDPDYERVEMAALLALCQLAPESVATATIGPEGGTISTAGASLTLPPGAVVRATEFHLRVPESPYAEVEIRANGQEHWQFQKPVVIRIDYARCGEPSGELEAWHIDPATKALLEDMGGVNDTIARRVSFSTAHLSGYAIAN
jgi:hypothetical protein